MAKPAPQEQADLKKIMRWMKRTTGSELMADLADYVGLPSRRIRSLVLKWGDHPGVVKYLGGPLEYLGPERGSWKQAMPGISVPRGQGSPSSPAEVIVGRKRRRKRRNESAQGGGTGMKLSEAREVAEAALNEGRFVVTVRPRRMLSSDPEEFARLGAAVGDGVLIDAPNSIDARHYLLATIERYAGWGRGVSYEDLRALPVESPGAQRRFGGVLSRLPGTKVLIQRAQAVAESLEEASFSTRELKAMAKQAAEVDPTMTAEWLSAFVGTEGLDAPAWAWHQLDSHERRTLAATLRSIFA